MNILKKRDWLWDHQEVDVVLAIASGFAIAIVIMAPLLFFIVWAFIKTRDSLERTYDSTTALLTQLCLILHYQDQLLRLAEVESDWNNSSVESE